MTGQGDVAGRLVETAARAGHPEKFPTPESECGPVVLDMRAKARAEAAAVLAAVLPLLADEIETEVMLLIGPRTPGSSLTYVAKSAEQVRSDAATLLRDLAVRVAR